MSAFIKLFWLALCLCFFGYCAYLAIHNEMTASIYIWPTIAPMTAPLWLIMLTSFSLGVLLMALAASLFLSKARLRQWSIEKKMAKLSQHNDDLQIKLQDKMNDN